MRLQRGHGQMTVENPHVHTGPVRDGDASTWPRPNDRGKRLKDFLGYHADPQLQRGHGQMTVENARVPTLLELAILASTWPRPNDRGKRGRSCGVGTVRASFNVAT